MEAQNILKLNTSFLDEKFNKNNKLTFKYHRF